MQLQPISDHSQHYTNPPINQASVLFCWLIRGKSPFITQYTHILTSSEAMVWVEGSAIVEEHRLVIRKSGLSLHVIYLCFLDLLELVLIASPLHHNEQMLCAPQCITR